MEQQTQQKIDPVSPEPSKFSEYQGIAVSYLKAWPALVMELFTKPEQSIAALPTQGKWDRPVIYAVASGLLSGAITYVTYIRFDPSGVLSHIVASTVASLVGVFLVGFFLNLICSIMAQDPKIYRSILFVSLVSIVFSVSSLVTHFHPMLFYLPMAANLYMLYKYVKVAGGATQKQAYIFIGILGGLALLSTLGLIAVGTQLSHDVRTMNELMKGFQER